MHAWGLTLTRGAQLQFSGTGNSPPNIPGGLLKELADLPVPPTRSPLSDDGNPWRRSSPSDAPKGRGEEDELGGGESTFLDARDGARFLQHMSTTDTDVGKQPGRA